MKTPSKNTQKAFAVASYIGSALKSMDEVPKDMLVLQHQINRAMQVYSRVGGMEHYHELSDKLGTLWEDLGDRYANVIEEDSIPLLVATFATLISPKDFKKFLAVEAPDIHSMVNDDFPKICESSLLLNDKLNILLGTKSVILMLPKKKKVKKIRPKVKSKAQIKHEVEQEEIRVRNERIKTFLQNRVKLAKGNSDASK